MPGLVVDMSGAPGSRAKPKPGMTLPLKAKVRRRKKPQPTLADTAQADQPTSSYSPEKFSSSSQEAFSASDYSDSEDEGTEDYRKGGYHPVQVGDTFANGRYVVERKLGWGHFSTVWMALDSKLQQHVALKIQKSAPQYKEAALDEITILQQVTDGDKDGAYGVVRLLDHFEHQGPHGRHVCMVMEMLGDNLLSLIKRYHYRGVPIPHVKQIAKQVLIGLDYLHSRCSIIHTDLKPENVLLNFQLGTESTQEPCTSLASTGDTLHFTSPTLPETGNGAACTINDAAGVASQAASLTKNQKKKLKRKQRKQAAAQPLPRAEQVSSADNGLVEEREGLAQLRVDSASSRVPYDDGDLTPPSSARMRDDPLNGQDFVCKIVDLGNACWTYKQFTGDIQTRQYRSPEALLGAKYSTPADIWSLACIIFELCTGDLLFDPRSGDNYDRDEDHLALLMELLGRMPRRIALGGKYSRQYFNRQGELRHIRKLRFWPLDQVLAEKYDLPNKEAKDLASFLLPMLDFVPERRPTAADCLKHPWLVDTYATAAVIDSGVQLTALSH
eukprot:jgi/Chlat1/923/Chrsp108S01360